MNELKFKIGKAMNYIPSSLIVEKRSADGLIVEKCPEVILIDGETWVLKDKNLFSEHYEREKE